MHIYRYCTIVAFTVLLTRSDAETHFLPPRLTQITTPFDHGEGPHWDERVHRLFFVDIQSGNVHSLDPSTGDLATMHFPGADAASVFTVAGDSELFVIAVNRTLLAVKWGGGKRDRYRTMRLAEVAEDKPTSRFNDGKVDRNGRIWIGTIGFEDASGLRPNDAALYRVCPSTDFSKPTLTPEVMLAPVNVSNGIAWNKDNNIMYYIDSPSRKVVQYKYNGDSGIIENPSIAFDFAKDPKIAGVPDGMTIDRDDNLWIALYGGGSIVHIDPRAHSILRIIAIPSRYVTSATFGGPHLGTLYVTTSRRSLTADERKWQPSAGAVFAVEGLKTGGLPVTHTNVLTIEIFSKFLCTEKENKEMWWCKDSVY